jgi:hypothetical protein
MIRQDSPESARKTDLSGVSIVLLPNLSADNNSTMTLTEQRAAVLCDPQFYLDRLSAEVYQFFIELLSKAILRAK